MKTLIATMPAGAATHSQRLAAETCISTTRQKVSTQCLPSNPMYTTHPAMHPHLIPVYPLPCVGGNGLFHKWELIFGDTKFPELRLMEDVFILFSRTFLLYDPLLSSIQRTCWNPHNSDVFGIFRWRSKWNIASQGSYHDQRSGAQGERGRCRRLLDGFSCILNHFMNIKITLIMLTFFHIF